MEAIDERTTTIGGLNTRRVRRESSCESPILGDPRSWADVCSFSGGTPGRLAHGWPSEDKWDGYRSRRDRSPRSNHRRFRRELEADAARYVSQVRTPARRRFLRYLARTCGRHVVLRQARLGAVAGSRRLAGADRTQHQRGGLDQGGGGFHAGGRSISFGRGRPSRHVCDGLSVTTILREVEGAAATRHVLPATAAEVGRRLVRIHSKFARSPAAAAEFATDAIFHAIRLEPYLLATAQAHPDRAAALEKLAETTMRTKLTLVHGDVSPKNILVGPQGPVFIDAECAWFGDPAFDLAFCLNHMLLKCLW